jgi:hypothetical protein
MNRPWQVQWVEARLSPSQRRHQKPWRSGISLLLNNVIRVQ